MALTSPAPAPTASTIHPACLTLNPALTFGFNHQPCPPTPFWPPFSVARCSYYSGTASSTYISTRRRHTGSICIEDGVRLGRNSRRELARRLVPTPLRSQKVPTKVPHLQWEEGIGSLLRLFESLISIYAPLASHDRSAAAGDHEDSACEVDRYSGMRNIVYEAYALAHRLVALFAISASTLPPSPRLLNIPPG
ncbi:hypothetical protein BKA70DRAFT_1440039 [Coprinopsis sp. MPI-PUGE-AT-0042]|nr:hypothetical protein BKA70DRAFT_1440039 [Coprinopsis sp. MPI-PUGE-AT-0042]